MLKGLITAFRTLSILPVPGQDTKDFATALYGFVFVGLFLGTVLYWEAFGLGRLIGNQWPEGSAFLLLISGVILTRGFHLDGVADFADGFWGGYDREKTLAIMKDSFLGTFGVVALVLLLLAKWIVLVRLLELSAYLWLISAYVISRAMMVELAVGSPYARIDGTASAFVKGAKQRHRFFALFLASAILYFLNGLPGLAALCFSFFLVRIYGLWCLKRVGGITGDLLGTCNEMVEVFVLIFAVAYEILEVTYF